MRPLLTVTRTGPAARPRQCRVLRSDDGDLMIEADGRLTACSTLSPTAALHRYRNLRLARQGWTTTFVRDDPEALTFEQVLEAIIPAPAHAVTAHSEPDEEDDEDLDEDLSYAVEETAWAGPHRIRLDNEIVLTTQFSDGTWTAVPVFDIDAPHEGWEFLIVMGWDSSSYAGVGLAGSGIEGLYRPRRGILAKVSSMDGYPEIIFRRAPRNAGTVELCQAYLEETWMASKWLAIQVPGSTEADAKPLEGDWCADCLTPRQRRLLVRRLMSTGEGDRGTRWQ